MVLRFCPAPGADHLRIHSRQRRMAAAQSPYSGPLVHVRTDLPCLPGREQICSGFHLQSDHLLHCQLCCPGGKCAGLPLYDLQNQEDPSHPLERRTLHRPSKIRRNQEIVGLRCKSPNRPVLGRFGLFFIFTYFLLSLTLYPSFSAMDSWSKAEKFIPFAVASLKSSPSVKQFCKSGKEMKYPSSSFLKLLDIRTSFSSYLLF